MRRPLRDPHVTAVFAGASSFSGRSIAVWDAGAVSAIKQGGYSGNVFGEARWWGRDLFGINHALVGSWPVVRIMQGKAQIVELRSVLDWWDLHGWLLLKHMREGGQMWDQLLENNRFEMSGAKDHTPRIRS